MLSMSPADSGVNHSFPCEDSLSGGDDIVINRRVSQSESLLVCGLDPTRAFVTWHLTRSINEGTDIPIFISFSCRYSFRVTVVFNKEVTNSFYHWRNNVG